jgi:hypothetical protein
MDDNQKQIDKLVSALKQLVAVELLKLPEDVAEDVTRIHAGEGELRFEIGFSSQQLNVLCSAQRGDGPSMEVFHIEAAYHNTSVSTSQDN